MVIEAGVARSTVRFDAEGMAEIELGPMAIRGTFDEDFDPQSVAGTVMVWYTLGSDRLRGLLESVGATTDQADDVLLALDAAALATEDVTDHDDVTLDPDIDYWRPDLIKVLTNHQRLWRDSPTGDGCSCGAHLAPGSSYADHVADEFEKEAVG